MTIHVMRDLIRKDFMFRLDHQRTLCVKRYL